MAGFNIRAEAVTEMAMALRGGLFAPSATAPAVLAKGVIAKRIAAMLMANPFQAGNLVYKQSVKPVP